MRTYLKDLIAMQKLDKESFVIDIGGYLGDYTQEILNRFNCHILLFEPNPEAFIKCKERFKNDTRVMVNQLAVGKEKQLRKLYLRKEGSSFFKNWAGTLDSIFVQEIPAHELLDVKADALKINCEGAEYEILEDLDTHDMIKNFKEILVQFHKTGGNIQKSREILSKTHKCIYSEKWDLHIRNV